MGNIVYDVPTLPWSQAKLTGCLYSLSAPYCANILKLVRSQVRERRVPALKVSSCQVRDEDQDGKLP